jgi:DNA-binding NarL/FixJ family response regulator
MYGPADESLSKNVLIVDDHRIVRRGLTELLSQQPNLAVRAAVASAEEALELAQREPLDLAIVDISLEKMDGLALTEILKHKYPALVVLILSMHDEHEYGARARRLGAAGYVAKQQAGDVLLSAIHEVLNGRTYYQADV